MNATDPTSPTGTPSRAPASARTRELQSMITELVSALSSSISTALADARAARASELASITRVQKDGQRRGSEFQDSAATERSALQSQFTARLTTESMDCRDRALHLARGLATPVSYNLTAADLCPAHEVRELITLGDLAHGDQATADAAFDAFVGIPTNARVTQLPALTGLLNAGHLVVEAASDDSQLPGVLASILAQAYLSAPPGQLAVYLFNPLISGYLDAFQIAGADGTRVLVNVAPNAQALEASLEGHVGHLGRVSTSMAGRHRSLGDLVAATGQHEHEYRLAILLNAPSHVSPKAMADLQRLFDQGATRGLSLLLHHDTTQDTPDPELFARTIAGQPVLRRVQDYWMLDRGRASHWVSADSLSDPELARHLMDEVRQAATAGVLPKVPLADLLSRTQKSSADGLQITLGRSGQAPMSISLGDTVHNLHNVLVGGAVGTGKTNLLKVMIYSLAASYSPEELELYLLDFKEGIEFRQFLGDDAPLPHARVVSTQSDIPFGLATLQHFIDEMTRRSMLFKAAGVTSIKDYRARGHELPRWVLFADEFQVLFEGDTNTEATERLESVVRKGRAYGLHVVLASQTLSGIRFSGGKDQAIFGQFPARVVLKMPPAESRIFLGQGNDAAAELRYRGQAVLNTNFGQIEDNHTLVVALADDEYVHDLHSELVRRHGAGSPRVYEGGEPVSARELLHHDGWPMPHEGSVPFWLGQECTVAARTVGCTWQRMPGSNLLALGNDEKTLISTLQLGALSFAASVPTSRVLVLDGLPIHLGRTAHIDEWCAALQTLGAEVTRYGADEAGAMLERAEELPDDGIDSLLVCLGPSYTNFKDAADEVDLRARLRVWGHRGIHLAGEWGDLRDLPVRPYDVQGDFHTLVFADAPTQSITDLLQTHRSAIPAPQNGRILMFSARGQQGVQQITAVHPLDSTDLAAWTQGTPREGALA